MELARAAQHLLRGPWSRLLTDCLQDWPDQAEGDLKETRVLLQLASVGLPACACDGVRLCHSLGAARSTQKYSWGLKGVDVCTYFCVDMTWSLILAQMNAVGDDRVCTLLQTAGTWPQLQLLSLSNCMLLPYME